jgi:acetyl esterase/lipase
VGHSAGAHIGALLATDTHYLTAEGKKTSDVIHGFIGLAGPYAFTPDEPDLEDMFGPPANYPRMQATTFVDGLQPPMLLLRGREDTVVKPLNLDHLQQAIHERGGYVESFTYPHTGHIDILGDLTWLGNSNAPVRTDISKFIETIDARTATK